MSILDRILQRTKARERGVLDGNHNFPASDATVFSETEENIVVRCREEAASRISDFKRLVSHIGLEVAEITRHIPTGFDEMLTQHRGALRRIVEANKRDFHDLALAAARFRRDYHVFRFLNYRTFEPRYAESLINFAGFVFLLVVFEAVANAWFFGQANASGLLGGSVAAALISLANVATGLIAGFFALRYLNHVRKIHLVWALPLLFLLLAIAFVINLAAGHYREVLLSEQDALIIEILPRLWLAPLALSTFESLVMMCLGGFIFIIALAKGYSAWDAYPGYATRHKRWQDSQCDLEDQRALVREELEDQRETGDRALKNQRDELRRLKAKLERSSQQLEAGLTALHESSKDITEAGAAAAATYRGANRQFRRDNPPAYFDQPLAIAPIGVPDEVTGLQQRVTNAAVEIAAAEKELAEASRALAELIPAIDEEINQMIEAADISAAEAVQREAREVETGVVHPEPRFT